MRTLLPPGRHVCDVPTSNDHQPLTLVSCSSCGTWWFWDWDPGGDIAGSPYRTWRQVRWWHFGLRRRIRRSGAR